MAITPLPPAPEPTDSTAEFNTKAFAWVASLDNFTTEANALATGADTDASTATTQAGIATTQAGISTTQAGIATTQAGISTTQAGIATTKAGEALASANAAAASYDQFDDRYLGSKTSDPSLDNDGNALLNGALYFNSVANEMRVYNGSSWQSPSVVGGTVASINVTGATTLGQNPTISSGTANGVAYLNGSKVLTTGSALTFDGTNLGVGGSPSAYNGKLVVKASDQPVIGYFGGTTYAARIGANASYAVVEGVDAATGVSSYQPLLIGGSLLKFDVSGSEQMRLTSTGLGIGTSSPSYKLHATDNGNINATSAITNSTAGTSSVARFLAISDAGNATFGMTSSSYTDLAGAQDALLINASNASGGMAFTLDGVLKMKLDSSGNLGLGVTPSAWGAAFKALQFAGGSGVHSNTVAQDFNVINQAYNNGSGYVYQNSSLPAARYQQYDGAHIWYNAPSGTAGNAISFTQAMTLDANGNRQIGTTSVVESARDTIQFQSSSGNTGISLVDAQANNTATYISFHSNVTKIGSITNNNNAATAYNTTSDYRLKENVTPMTGALAKVAALKPCTYTWKADGSDGQGFIAHELQAVVPDAVTGEKDAIDKDGKPKYQGVDTSFLVATLTAAIQELKAEFDAYKLSHP